MFPVSWNDAYVYLEWRIMFSWKNAVIFVEFKSLYTYEAWWMFL